MRIILNYSLPNIYFLPLWKKYYLPFFDESIVTVKEDKSINDADWDKWITKDFNNSLPGILKTYDLVMITDADEIIVPNPEKYKDLGDYFDRFTGAAVACDGYHIMEMENDPPFDLNKRITDQRHYWIHDHLYDKPVITKIPYKFYMGRHHAIGLIPVDKDLVMFHLRDA